MESKKSHQTLLKHTLVFSVFVLLAQVTGLVRDLYLARVFGVGGTLDIYYMAFKIPDFLNVFYSVFLGSVVFIPLLTKAKETPLPGGGINPPAWQGGENRVITVVSEVGSMVMVLVTVAAALLFVFMPQLSEFLAPTWTTEKLSLLTHLSRILLLAQFFFPVGILAGSIGMVYNRPFYMAVSGFVYNFFILLGAIILVPIFGIYGVVVSILFGALMFALIQIFPQEVRHIYSNFKFKFDFSDWVKFFKSNFSRFFAVLAYQLFGIFILYIASFAGEGGVSIFSISYNVYMAIFFVLGASLGTAAMPNIAKLHVTGNHTEQKENLNNALVYMFFIGIFFTMFAIAFSFDIIKILYYFSHLTFEKEMQISLEFMLLVLALPFFNLLEIIRKYLYSTNQIFLAGVMTVLLLVGVLLSSLYFNKIMMLEILPTLAFSILVSNILCFVFALFMLGKKDQLTSSYLLKNTYKSILISFLSFIIYIFSMPYLVNLSGNYLVELFARGIYLFVIFVAFVYIFNDKIGKSIVKQLTRFLW
jgi:putative peptidoglycan lipid II flippase